MPVPVPRLRLDRRPVLPSPPAALRPAPRSPRGTPKRARVRVRALHGLVISSRPAPGPGSVAPLGHPVLIDLRDDLAVTGQQRLRRAHLRAQRQLPLCESVGSVLTVFLDAAGFFRAAATGAERALIHFSARAEIAHLRILRCPEGAGVETVAAADAQVLRMQHHAFFRRKYATDGADGSARRVVTVHAGHGYGALSRLAIVDSH